VVGRDHVDACGTVLDAWTVSVTGTIASASTTTNLAITATYHVATQFGGIIVADDVQLNGTDHGTSAAYHDASVISTRPQDPMQ
jgi:hypothetical protein